MIPIKLQIILILFSAFGIFFIFNMIKKYRLELKYSLLWIAMGLVLIILSIFPSVLAILSNWMSVEKPSNALFFFGIIFSMAISFSLTVALSRNSIKIKELSQEIGLLKKELKDIKNFTTTTNLERE